MPEYAKMTVAQLKTELGTRGLEKTGTKADLVNRLTENDEGTESKTEVEVEEEVTVEAIGEETEEAPEEAVEAEEAEEEEPMDETEAVEEETEEHGENEDEEVEQEELSAEDLVVKEQVGETDGDGDGDVKFDDEDQKNDDAEEMETGDKSDNKDKAEEGEKSDKKGKKGPKKWVAIMENEKTAKVLDELKKINKLESLKGRSREIFQAHETHKVRMFPIIPDDMSDSLIIEALKLSTSSMVRFSSTDPASDRKGMLEITFPRRSILDEYFPKLSLYKESINVLIDKKENEWRDLYKQAVEIPDHAGDLEKLRLFAPSLPQSVVETDLWDYFPKAREILLIEAKPRKHAYITFLSEESMIESVEALNIRGPQKDDFKFCRLLRLAEIVKYLPRREFKGYRTPRKGPYEGPRTPRAGQRAPRAGFTGNVGSGKKPFNASSSGKVTPRQSTTGNSRASRDIQRRRETMPRRRDDRRDRGTSYWGAPRQRTSGLETSFSQLQQPAPMVNPQAGLQVLDTLLTTLGQMGGSQQGMASGSGAGRQQDRRPMSPRGSDNRGRYNIGQKRAHSPNGGRGNSRRKRQRSVRGGYDDRRGNYNQGNYGSSSMSYSRGDDYNRQSGQGGERMYTAMDAVNKIQRLRDTLGQGQRQNYGGSGYRQDSYY